MINGGPYRGELYEVGDTEFYSLMNIEDYDYNRMITTEDTEVEQIGSTEPLNTDSDDDGVTDGEEVLGWKITVSIRKADNTGIKLIVVGDIESDPTVSDYDRDNLPDGAEYENITLPYKDYTDDDGLNDDMEITTEGTNPTDFDTDRDYLPDGYIEGWRRRNKTSWKVMSGSFANNTRDS